MDIAARQLTGPGAHVILKGISVLPLCAAEEMGAVGRLCTWSGQRTPQCPPPCAGTNLALTLGSGQPATRLDQLLSVSLAFREAAESFLQKKGRDFPESQG